MSKNKNEFKKQDAKGNKLPEVIGKGLNLENAKKAIEERKKDDYIRFRCTKGDKINFKLACKRIEGLDESDVSRALMIAFTNGKIKIK